MAAEESKKESLQDFVKKLGEEEVERARDNKGHSVIGKTGYPKPLSRYHMVLEDFNNSVEEIYYWLRDYVHINEGFPDVKKINDVFSASEQSSFFGSAQQRLGMQQEKVSMYLATIGKLVKELFQIIRELRIIDERVGYYEDSFNADSRTKESAEIVLKGIWVDQVEQGQKNPASVYGMARELQFTTLPDLFFGVHPKSMKDIDQEVNKLDFNNKVKEVLKRKLRSFMQWKETTYYEMRNRRRFTLKYLRQHFNVIRLYNSWLKPYLRNMRRLTMADRTDDADLVSAFEGSIVEVENLFYKLPPKGDHSKEIKRNQNIYSVVLVSMKYRSKPAMNYHHEYQRGPLHVGKAEIVLRSYAWDKEKIEQYAYLKSKEDLEMLGEVDGSIKAAMESLGEELERYLQEAGEETELDYPEKNAKKEKKTSKKLRDYKNRDPFLALAYGVKETLFDPLKNNNTKSKGVSSVKLDHETKAAEKVANGALWQTYKNFKKNNSMLAW
ncbi:MAG: hypothetical protein ACQESF_03170 [Nanobdellota archaeon]